MIFGPFDKISNDQEIAGKAHAFDDAKLKFEPFFVLFDRGGVRNNGEPILKARAGLPLEFLHLVIGKFWQDRVAAIGHKRAAPGDFHRVLKRFGQVRKEHSHFFGRLEIVLRCQPSARFLLVHISAVGNADQSIVRLVHLGFREVDIVGGHQRNVHRIGHFNKGAFGQAFGFGCCTILARVALKFDVEPVAKGCRQTLHQRFAQSAIAGLQHLPDRAIRPAGQADHTV